MNCLFDFYLLHVRAYFRMELFEKLILIEENQPRGIDRNQQRKERFDSCNKKIFLNAFREVQNSATVIVEVKQFIYNVFILEVALYVLFFW